VSKACTVLLPLLLTLVAVDSFFVPLHCHGISLDTDSAIWLAGDSGIYRIVDREPQLVIDQPAEAITVSNIASGDVFVIVNTHNSHATFERYTSSGSLVASDSIELHVLERPPGIPVFSGLCLRGNDPWLYFNAGAWFETGCWRIADGGEVLDRWSPVEIAPLAVQGLLWDDSLYWVGERNWSSIYAYRSSGGFYRSCVDQVTLAAPPLVGIAGQPDDLWAAFLRPGGTRLVRYGTPTTVEPQIRASPMAQLEIFPTLVESGGIVRLTAPIRFTVYDILGRKVLGSEDDIAQFSLSAPPGPYFLVPAYPSTMRAVKIFVVR
jgi:hypothetical protein